VDTPGHSDFGGEVERALKMVDGVMLLVDASEGPLPQTRYVLSKALEAKLPPIVVINKIDRPDARAQEVLNEVYDLFIDLDAGKTSSTFPCSTPTPRSGTATTDIAGRAKICSRCSKPSSRPFPNPKAIRTAPLQILVANLDYSDYLGRSPSRACSTARCAPAKTWHRQARRHRCRRPRSPSCFQLRRTEAHDITETELGDIVAVAGVEGITIGETITDVENPAPLPHIAIDEPTIAMQFTVNTSPFAGREGQYVTSRNLRERLDKELLTNVSMRVEETDTRTRSR
jgi:GTP-binding protein